MRKGINRFGASQQFLRPICLGDSTFFYPTSGNSPLNDGLLKAPFEIFRLAATSIGLDNIANTDLPAQIIANPTADSVIIHAGGNDANFAQSLAAMQADATSIMDQCEAAGLHLIMDTINPGADVGGMTAGEWQNCLDYNAWLIAECSARRHICNNTFPLFGNPSNPEILDTSWRYLGTDPAHLNAAGSAKLARSIDAAITRGRKLPPAWGYAA